ncbi:MAG: hypothetical protein LBK83_07640 [Treponema sp.]|jgi:hypothetical protein|nr:hypothetical protein [Treponema sp.]
MQNSELQYPVLRVTINGTPVDRRPAAFRLMTDQGVPAVIARLSYPADVPAGKPGDALTVSLSTGGADSVLFTGELYGAAVHGAYRELSLTDGYKKLCDTAVMPAYRKEKAAVILEDTLEASGITTTNITCPDLTLNRFSTERVSAARCIHLLIHALGEFGEAGLRYFFDAENIFHFGKKEGAGRNEGPEINLETGNNIISRGEGRLEILPAPVRHSQNITVDGRVQETVRTDMIISQSNSRLTIWVKEPLT